MGSLSLKKKISTSLATRYNSTYYIRFKGPAGITFGNFFNAGIAAVINSGGAYNFYFDENLNNPTTYYTDGGDWYDSNGITITTNNIIPINTIVQIYNDFADYTINFGGNIENYFSGQTSIKKQNLGGGKINLRPRVYAFIATGTGLSPNINNLRFYDTGLTQSGQPIYYDETKVYWLTYISSVWIIALIGTVGASGLFVKFSSINPVGSYTGSGGYSGTVTIAAI